MFDQLSTHKLQYLYLQKIVLTRKNKSGIYTPDSGTFTLDET